MNFPYSQYSNLRHVFIKPQTSLSTVGHTYPNGSCYMYLTGIPLETYSFGSCITAPPHAMSLASAKPIPCQPSFGQHSGSSSPIQWPRFSQAPDRSVVAHPTSTSTRRSALHLFRLRPCSISPSMPRSGRSRLARSGNTALSFVDAPSCSCSTFPFSPIRIS